jgi:uncharacterized membrane protein HdeD (DUF308 family)
MSPAMAATDNWWTLALRAASAILLGIAALLLPAITVTVLATLFGVYVFIDGVLAIGSAVHGMRARERWGWMMARGIAGVIAGMIAMLLPPVGIISLAWLVAAWALATGALEIATAFAARGAKTVEWLLLAAGLLSVLLAVVIAVVPGVGAVLIVATVGAYAIAHGVVMLAMAVRVRQRRPVHAHL